VNPIFGKLTLEQIPYTEPIIMGAVGMAALGVLVIAAAITYYGRWQWLWSEYLTSVDHKKIGIMYVLLGLVMLLRGFTDAVMMRIQQSMSLDPNPGYLPPHHYDQVFSAHGVIMIFFVAMPLVVGLMNIAVPLQIGARDVAFPFLNSLSFWLTFSGAMLINASLVFGEFAKTGWAAYPPLSELSFSPDVGVDYYIWGLQISGIGTLLTGVNFLATILRMRAPGMKMMRMPIFVWTAFCTNVLIVAAFPILTVTLALLGLDRYVGTHFFTNDGGGEQMMYVNLFWAWGHPEVYILVLPAFGVFSEVVATFSGKPIFGYKSMVWATIAITFFSFVVWLHHFFTMGAGANVNAFFGIATMIISVPTGVKMFNWLFTMFRGRVRFSVPMLWSIGFIITFTIGGMTGVLLAMPGADFVLHNSLFLVAHFHNTIIGGVVFGMFAGINYWFPKATGIRLSEPLGRASFWCWLIGFYVAFMPLYVLGFMGMTRRLNHYSNPEWQPWLILAAVGVAIIAVGILCTVLQIVYSIWRHEELRDHTGDPWDGRTLEWSTSSPPPIYNFAETPLVTEIDAFANMKANGSGMFVRSTPYSDIHMPRNTAAGFLMGLFSIGLGFGLIWHIWWMVGLSAIAMFTALLVRLFDDDIAFIIPADEVKEMEMRRLKGVGQS
jgi:cytochrome o ubiquinol oxidase subunit I